jgi:superfamily II DNA or RNA helicase
VRWTAPRILAEELRAPAEPLALLLRADTEAPAAAVAGRAASALLDLPPVPPRAPPWLAPHQTPAFQRLIARIEGSGGALLADAVGLGKSYVALAVAAARAEPFALVVPGILAPQWRDLLHRLELEAPIVTHETLSVRTNQLSGHPTIRLFVVDEAHRFRNPETRRYGSLAALVVGRRVLLVTATPVHNRLADLLHLLRLFLRDHALAGLGVPSLRRAARAEMPAETIAAVAARFVVARSRDQVRRYPPGSLRLAFPGRASGRTVRLPTLPADELPAIIERVRHLSAAAGAAPLFRLTLLRLLASSAPAFRATLERYRAFLDLARRAAEEHRTLTPSEFQRLFPRQESGGGDMQLVLFPLLLEPGPPRADVAASDLGLLAELRARTPDGPDPKLDALVSLLADAEHSKTIVFTESRATARHLQRRLQHTFRLATLSGERGWLGATPATRSEVLRVFAPAAQGAPPAPPTVRADVLVATDLLSEGLNLQDAARVVHYDLPWSPARLAQRVGRIDRLGSPHAVVETVAFLPPEALEEALALEARLSAKAHAAALSGAPPVETLRGASETAAALDWADRLQALACPNGAWVPGGIAAAVVGERGCAVLVVRMGAAVEALVVNDAGVARADPELATACLERALAASPRPLDGESLARAVAHAAPLVRARLAAIAAARWRAVDRDRLSRRLIPWVLSEARRAARKAQPERLAALDSLVARLSAGMTAGEEYTLEALLERRAPLTITALLAWNRRLPPLAEPGSPPEAELVAALQILTPCPPRTEPG